MEILKITDLAELHKKDNAKDELRLIRKDSNKKDSVKPMDLLERIKKIEDVLGI